MAAFSKLSPQKTVGVSAGLVVAYFIYKNLTAKNGKRYLIITYEILKTRYLASLYCIKSLHLKGRVKM